MGAHGFPCVGVGVFVPVCKVYCQVSYYIGLLYMMDCYT